jgi:WD40 repeat protein
MLFHFEPQHTMRNIDSPCRSHSAVALSLGMAGRGYSRRFQSLLKRCIAAFMLMAWALLGMAQTPPAATGTSLVINAGGHVGPVRRIALDPSGQLAVTASDDKTAIVWNTADMRVRHVLRVPVAGGDVGRLYGVAKDPVSDLVAVAGTTASAAAGSHRIYLFDTSTGGFVRSFDARGGDVKRLVWSQDGRFMAAVYARDPAVRVFGVDGALWFEQRLPADTYGLSITADGRLAVASFDRRVRLFRVLDAGRVEPDGDFATTLTDPVSVRHSPDGRWLAVGYFSRHDDLGDRGSLRKRVTIDVYDAAARQLAKTFEFRDVEQGNLMTVAWQPDGRAIHAGGTGYAQLGQHMIKRMAWPSGEVTSTIAASDSIQDMAPMADGRLAFVSFDGTVGVLDAERVSVRSNTRTQRVVDAADLLISEDARRVQWRVAGELQAQRSFDVGRRRVAAAVENVSAATAYDRSTLMVIGVRNREAVSVNGHPVAMLPNELARASAVLPDRQAVIIGATGTLRRIGTNGQVQWTRLLHTEARAVHVSTDGQLVVAALADGSIRWYRASDGAALLSLLVLRDGRWVLWTESGHFDAGPGAEDLVGWLITRGSGEQADFYGVSRLRDRMLRPDIIDQVLVQQDLPRAIAVANESQVQLAQSTAQDDDVVSKVVAAQQPVVLRDAMPAVVALAKAPPEQLNATTMDVEVKVTAQAHASEQILKARVDGRPVEVTLKRVQKLPNGETIAHLSIQLVKASGRMQIAAEGRNGFSMPVELDYRSSAPALRDRPRPSLFVVSVGVSRYATPGINLMQASKDARDIARALERQQAQFYERVHTRVLVDEGATRAAVLDALQWLQTTPSPDDTAVLFIAGHGVTDAADTYYFLPHDMHETRLQRTAVSESQLRHALAQVKGRMLFFVDTCYAGRAIGRLDRRETGRMVSGLSQSEHGVIVFSGSAPRQESLESTAWGNGAFTKALIEGLAGPAKAEQLGFVTHVSLDRYVVKAVSDLTAGRQTPSTALPHGVVDYPIAKISTTAAPGVGEGKEKTP